MIYRTEIKSCEKSWQTRLGEVDLILQVRSYLFQLLFLSHYNYLDP